MTNQRLFVLASLFSSEAKLHSGQVVGEAETIYLNQHTAVQMGSDKSKKNILSVFYREIWLHFTSWQKLDGTTTEIWLSNLNKLSSITRRFLTAEQLDWAKGLRTSAGILRDLDLQNQPWLLFSLGLGKFNFIEVFKSLKQCISSFNERVLSKLLGR